jgi:hypothetical protein
MGIAGFRNENKETNIELRLEALRSKKYKKKIFICRNYSAPSNDCRSPSPKHSKTTRP